MMPRFYPASLTEDECSAVVHAIHPTARRGFDHESLAWEYHLRMKGRRAVERMLDDLDEGGPDAERRHS